MESFPIPYMILIYPFCRKFNVIAVILEEQTVLHTGTGIRPSPCPSHSHREVICRPEGANLKQISRLLLTSSLGLLRLQYAVVK
eukprot:scaffold30053_cov16-Prasinocladus_malaysianus.AAC.1